MDTKTLETTGAKSLTDRVEQLERTLRKLRVILAFAVLVGAVVGFTAVLSLAKAQDDKQAEMYRVGGLVLVDKNGRSRGTWAVLDDGDVVLKMNDARENPRVVMLVDKEGHAEVSLLDGAGNARGSWVAAANGETEFLLSDSKGKPRLGAKVEANGAYFQINDGQGVPRTLWSVIAADGVDKAEFGLYDKGPKRRLAMFSNGEGTPAIVFLDVANPMAVLGGWYVKDSQLLPMSKGTLPDALGGR